MAQPRLHRLFLHFFDVHLLEEKLRTRALARDVRREAEQALKLALLAASEVLVPAAAYFEQPDCRRIVRRLAPIYDRGVLSLVASGKTVEEFIDAKLAQYPPGSHQFASYLAARRAKMPHPPFKSRTRNSTSDLVSSWMDTLAMPGFPNLYFERFGPLPKGFEKAWSEVPEKLGGLAVIRQHVQPLVHPNLVTVEVNDPFHRIINERWVANYARELRAGLVTDMELLASEYRVLSGGPDLPYQGLVRALREQDVLKEVVAATPQELLSLRGDPRVHEALRAAMRGVPWKRGGRPIRILGGMADLPSLAEEMVGYRPGAEEARKYELAAARFFLNLFAESLTEGVTQARLWEGRQLVDIFFRNTAAVGFFKWVHERWGATYVVIECKNYSEDISNPELAQITSRFSHHRGHFGILVCRYLANRPLMIERCRDAAFDKRGVVIVLTDEEVRALAQAGPESSWGGIQSPFLAERVREVTS